MTSRDTEHAAGHRALTGPEGRAAASSTESSTEETDSAVTISVGILADPGLAADVVDRLSLPLPERLDPKSSRVVTWTVDTLHDPVEAMYPDHSALIEKARTHVRETVWDVVICVTDQPIGGSGVVVASLHVDDRVCLVSLPTFGGMRLRAQVDQLVTAVITVLASRLRAATHEDATDHLRRHLAERHWEAREPADDSGIYSVVRRRRWAKANLLAGMVRVNRPWRLIRGLSTALAGAMAGIAFGVLYSSIWSLGAALSPLRLAGLTVASISALTAWIIFGHGLWEGSRPDRSEPTLHTRMRNASTLITVTIGSLAFYLTMLAISFAGVLLVIPADYLTKTLGTSSVSLPDYLTIALVASALGTLAGAVGSGLEDDVTVREATYGYREQQRWRQVERQTEEDAPIRHYRRS